MASELQGTNTKLFSVFLQDLQKERHFCCHQRVKPLAEVFHKMHQSDIQYRKVRWFLTIVGLLLYVVDTGTDIKRTIRYIFEKHFLWAGLSVLFNLAGLVVTQIFSYVWYRDDMKNVLINPEGKTPVSGMSKVGLAVLHLLGMGIFARYYHLLKQGHKLLWTTQDSYTVEERRNIHHNLFCMAADLSMLKLFECFLESVPQLLLQLHIVLGHGECSVLEILSMVLTFLSTAWALVDYRRCLRRSIPDVREMPSGLPTVIYLLYKLCTITSHILSYTLLLMLSVYSTIALTFLWLVGMTWTHLLQTNFCRSKGLEFLYRAVIGVILMFTFFNVKGQNTRSAMIIYYFFYSLLNFSAPALLACLKPELMTATALVVISVLILGFTVLGLVYLVLYYVLLHPRGTWREADEVDGPGNGADATRRIRRFLQP
uniref:XK-related protein 9 n=1 Tax=Scatophagus argus TaxID=75038 RepID=UPI001ED81609|nr:XK-related protein 9 [Scatophagus argus]